MRKNYMVNSLQLRVVNGSSLQNDISAQVMIATFYGFEMKNSLGWSVEKRFCGMRATQALVGTGQYLMIVAETGEGMPVGMLVYYQPSGVNMRLINSLYVVDTYRGQGIGDSLLSSMKEGIELHTYATPLSVSWYELKGFRVVNVCDDRTVSMTTSKEDPDYNITARYPIFSKGTIKKDRKFIKEIKKTERRIERRRAKD